MCLYLEMFCQYLYWSPIYLNQLLKCWHHSQRVPYWYHYLSYLASHFYRKETTKGQESSLVPHHFFSLPIWKIYNYLLHYPVLLFDIFLLEKIWSMFSISHQFHKILILLILKRYKGNLKQNIIIHGHNTRSKLYFHVQFCKTVLFKKSVVNMGFKLHNNVPDSIKKLDKLGLFTKKN